VCAPWCTTWRSWYQVALGGIMEGYGNVKLQVLNQNDDPPN